MRKDMKKKLVDTHREGSGRFRRRGKSGVNRCDRCKTPTNITKMSWFNTDDLCDACQKQEEAHPDFAYAKSVEHEAVKNGNTNFPGVGWPGPNGRVDFHTQVAVGVFGNHIRDTPEFKKHRKKAKR